MNLASMRSAVRGILTAGGGINTNINSDTFWVDKEIDYYINNAIKQVYRAIKRAQVDYFTRILRTTDSALLLMGRTFTPSTLALVSGTGNYTLPPDFVAMKLITDLSSDPLRFSACDITTERFRVSMNENAIANSRELYYDIIGLKTLVIRPIPVDSRDLEFIYQKALPSLTEYSTGDVTVATNGGNTVTFSGTALSNFVAAGDEIIIGSSASVAPTPDPSIDYPVIRTVVSATEITLDAPYTGATISSATKYRIASVPEFPPPYHDVVVHLAVKLAAMQGPNPHLNLASLHGTEASNVMRQLIDDIEVRQLSDVITSEAYLEGLIE